MGADTRSGVCAWCNQPALSPFDFAAWPDPTGPVFTVHLACQEAWLAAGKGPSYPQLLSDRDDLVAVLEEILPLWRIELENEGPGQVDLLLADLERYEALLARIKDPHDWVCSDCGTAGSGFHACPGRPGEQEF